MKVFKAIIADDEIHLRKGLKTLLNRHWPELEICCEAENGNQALEAVDRYAPDIAFLDIRMPGMTGLKVAKCIHDRCRVVFITAYDRFAVDAFEAGAFDYILKPVTEKRLVKTVDRLKTSLMSGPVSSETGILQIIRVLENRQPSNHLRLIKVRQGQDIRFVPVSDIYYFMARDKYTTVKTQDLEYLIRTPVKELEQQLDQEIFWRVHRSTIVNSEKIVKVRRTFTYRMEIVFNGIKETIPVSRSHEYLFRQA